MNYEAKDILTTPQTMTAAWADVGSEINCLNYNRLLIYMDVDINSSNNLQLRGLRKRTEGADEEYQELFQFDGSSVISMEPAVYELDVDADGKYVLTWDITGVKFLQLQAKAGTVGATGADLESVYGELSTQN